jgi:hypothetical protein
VPAPESASAVMTTYEIPRRRGRGRPPLKARTDAGFSRGGPGATMQGGSAQHGFLPGRL